MFLAGPDALILRGPLSLSQDGRTRLGACCRCKKGDRIPLQLTWFPSHEQPPAYADPDQLLASTDAFWRDWAGKCTYQGRYRDAVVRSLLTLKAMTYAPTGGIVAAPTTSLPEEIGGVRNWDYRFCWLRDASLTLDAFMIGGYVEEAHAFRDWLLRAVAGDPAELQIMYAVDGFRRLTEFELPWLPGLRGVEAGARRQRRHRAVPARRLRRGDVVHLRGAAAWGCQGRRQGWRSTAELIAFIEKRLAAPRRRHLGGARRAAPLHALEGDGLGRDRSRRARDRRVRRSAATRAEDAAAPQRAGGADPRRGLRARLQPAGGRVHAVRTARSELDASVLVIPHFGFLPGTDPRVQGTVAAVEKTLLRDGFVLRYGTEHGTDGLPGTEGAFLACSFWLADNYAFAGRMKEAEALFERLLSLRNHLGLLSEEYDPKLQRQIGNFPQAFSHLALIMTAQIIESVSQKREWTRPAVSVHAPAP